MVADPALLPVLEPDFDFELELKLELELELDAVCAWPEKRTGVGSAGWLGKKQENQEAIWAQRFMYDGIGTPRIAFDRSFEKLLQFLE